jgi:zinc/manganese transport system ATP-binding protein
VLEVQDISYRYPGPSPALAIERLTLTLTPGSLTALIGPNGAGKSTLLRLLLGQITPCSGQLRWRGAPLAPPHRPRLALLPQRRAIQWEVPIRVRDLVALGTLAPSPAGPPRSSPAIAVEEVLALLGLSAVAGERLSRLSGGQQQRALLGRVLVQKAELLLLDEPFSFLDPPARGQLLQLLRQQAEQGRIVLVSSHDWGTSLEQYDRVLLLATRLLADGPPAAVRPLLP